MALVGVQPVLTQVPPTRWRSITATFIPAPAKRNAKDGPAWPVPMMIASKSGMTSLSRSRRRHYNNRLLMSFHVARRFLTQLLRFASIQLHGEFTAQCYLFRLGVEPAQTAS